VKHIKKKWGDPEPEKEEKKIDSHYTGGSNIKAGMEQ